MPTGQVIIHIAAREGVPVGITLADARSTRRDDDWTRTPENRLLTQQWWHTLWVSFLDVSETTENV